MKERIILIENEYKEPKDCSFGLPWTQDAICYNYNPPKECVLASDVNSLVNDRSITGIFIGCDLHDYSFLREITALKQLYIYNSTNLCDFSFLDKQYQLNQLYISESKIDSLTELALFLKQKEKANRDLDYMERIIRATEGICIRSVNDLDISVLKTKDFYVSEIIVNGEKYVRY